MGRTKAVYEFVRLNLGIRMHGRENLTQFADGLNETELTIGVKVLLNNRTRIRTRDFAISKVLLPLSHLAGK